MAILWTDEPVAWIDNRVNGMKVESAPSVEALVEILMWLCSREDVQRIAKKVIREMGQQQADEKDASG